MNEDIRGLSGSIENLGGIAGPLLVFEVFSSFQILKVPDLYLLSDIYRSHFSSSE